MLYMLSVLPPALIITGGVVLFIGHLNAGHPLRRLFPSALIILGGLGMAIANIGVVAVHLCYS